MIPVEPTKLFIGSRLLRFIGHDNQWELQEIVAIPETWGVTTRILEHPREDWVLGERHHASLEVLANSFHHVLPNPTEELAIQRMVNAIRGESEWRPTRVMVTHEGTCCTWSLIHIPNGDHMTRMITWARER